MRRAMSLTGSPSAREKGGGGGGGVGGGMLSFGKTGSSKSPPGGSGGSGGGREEIPPASMSRRVPHSISSRTNSMQAARVDESPYDKKVLVSDANKQYELTYAKARWKQARETTAKPGTSDGNGSVEYGDEDEIQAAYAKLFGPPKSRLIGAAEQLMAC
ncbi:hypothetical protein T484DRAFT_1912660 [Baffinella frigidus]|nr:hypothetical protein T484DRAFT_1912660 [Cryptophyta sp. CCMP2293]